ncbi:MAG: circadian clock protein KaiC [Polyangiaceae bacterium]|nr:circadian clock protein KaiC [Polyangiaceae bacterium]
MHTNLCSTGISGLDDILRGGLPRNRFYLVEGHPGAGKTTLALQYLLEGAKSGERGLYITLSETQEELVEVATSHGWDLDTIATFELSAAEQQQANPLPNTVFYASEVELAHTMQVILQEVEKIKPSRIVFDSLSELRLLAQDPLRYRRQMLALKHYFAGRKCTVFLLDDKTANIDHHVQSIAHGVISLDQVSPDYGITRRRLEITKLRGVNFRAGKHDYTIQTGGLEVFPRLIAAEHANDFDRSAVSSGVPALDTLLGGGLDRGTSTIIMGPSGTGKSNIAARFAVAAAERGENVASFIFDETIETYVGRAAGLGMNMRTPNISMRQVDPAELSPGEFVAMLRQKVEQANTKLLIIDSLNGYLNAMTEERMLMLQLHELLTYLNKQGVVTILTLAQIGMLGIATRSPVDLTYLGDAVLLLRFFEHGGALKKALSVVKKRTGAHEETIRELSFSGSKISVGEPLRAFKGILTGTPAFMGNAGPNRLDGHEGEGDGSTTQPG